ncbi:MAG: acyltransferase family protein, partial [Marmoricola sp.]
MTSRRTDLVAPVRAISVLLVVAGQLWLVCPFTNIDDVSPLDGFLRSGNLAIVGLLACSGYVMTRLVTSPPEPRGAMTSMRAGLRSGLTVIPVLVLVCAGVWVMSLLDSTDSYSSDITRSSLIHVFSFNWNNYVRVHPLGVRSDLAGLWFFSVEAQLTVALLVVVVLFRRFRRLLILLVVAGLVFFTWWNFHVFDTKGWFQASLRSDTHVDAVLWGALAALVCPRLRWTPRTASSAVGCAALVLVGLVLGASYFSLRDFYLGPATLMAFAVSLVLGAAAASDGAGRLFELAGEEVPVLHDVGRNWAYAFAVAPPVFYALARNTSDWDNASRLFVALALVAGIIFV